tara:strand:- start:458 stop:622 length:165 start_codon:yes stop_codon:yes gene_type:complete
MKCWIFTDLTFIKYTNWDCDEIIVSSRENNLGHPSGTCGWTSIWYDIETPNLWA